MGGCVSEGRWTPGLAKVSRPRPTKVYPRTRLFKRLERFGERPVVWISGPPGAGKTTLVTSYLDTKNLSALWYQLDCGDGDAATFFHYLGLAAPLQKTAAPLPRLTPERRADLEVFTRRYFEQLYAALDTPFVLVFDNYHAIPADSDLHDVFRWGLEQIPETGQVVVISRGAPPNSLGRLESSRALAFLDADDLRLRLNESKGIARLYRRWDKGRELIPALHHSTEGWTAGLVLMLEHTDYESASGPEVTAGSRDNRFRYFGGEILDRIEPETRDVLLKTALLPGMTTETAAEISANHRAGRIIAGMHKRNYFTERLVGSEPVYRYHPLFREFLLDEIEKTLSGDELAALRRRASEMLERNGRLEEAAEVCRESRDWESLAHLCHKLAPDLLAQGRTDTLQEWLLAISREKPVADDPWIKYWLAHVTLPFDPKKAARLFEVAFTGFQDSNVKNDKATWLSAWCGVVDAIVYSWDDFSRLDAWIENLETFERDDGIYPSEDIETRVAVSMFSALIFRRPQHPEINNWAERGLSLARRHDDPAQLVRAVEFQSHFFAWIGDLARAGALLEEINEFLAHSPVPVIVLLGNRMQEAVCRWNTAEFEAALTAVENGLELGRNQGVHLLNSRLAAQGVYASLGAGKLDDAEGYLEIMADTTGTGRHLDISHLHYLRGWLAILRGDTGAALRESERATALAEEMGTPFPTSLAGIIYARSLHVQGDHEGAVRRLAISRNIGEAIRSRTLLYQIALVSADFALAVGDLNRGLSELKEGFETARRNSFWMCPGWDPVMLARLCGFALEYDIETDFIHQLIKRRGLTPPETRPPGAKWPWPVQIRTLGSFSIEIDGQAVRFDRKAQLRPMEFLCTLVSLGGDNVNERRLADILWPESEGDAALQSLATTLHRTRKLLGRDDAIIRSEGRISLNRNSCWVDALAFNEAVDINASISSSPDGRERLLESLTLYGGAFLGEHNDSAWSISMRERLQELFAHVVIQLARSSEEQGQWTEATSWYQFGIERAPVSESLYRGLIRCSLEQGETAAAVTAYRRCENALKTALGVKPSRKTRELATTFLHSD